MQVHYLLKRSYRRFKEERCLRTPRNIRRRTDHGQEVEEGGTGGIGCSVFLGRSNFSTTHFSLAECSPNPLQKQIIIPSRPSPVSDERIYLNETDSMVNVHKTISTETNSIGKEDGLNLQWKEKRDWSKLHSKDLFVQETCLDNEEDN
jgi:hypothetical protein